MKESRRTLISVLNAKGFNKTFATLGDTKLTITDGDVFREHTIESTDDWVETDSNGCISAVEVFGGAKPYTIDFKRKNQKIEDIANHDIIHIIKENLPDDVLRSLMDEFVNRYNEDQHKFYTERKDNKYSKTHIWNAMQFAVHEITGKNLRHIFLDTMVEDFLSNEI